MEQIFWIVIFVFIVVLIIQVIRIPFHIDEMNSKMNEILKRMDTTNEFLSKIRNSLKK